MATKLTAEQRFDQIEDDLRKLARMTMKSAGAHPDLVAILQRGEARETRPYVSPESRAAA